MGYDVRRWRLDIDVDPDARTFSGSVSVHFSPFVDLRRFVLDSSGLTIHSVEHALVS